MEKVYVIKNIVTKKYISGCDRWTKDISKAELIDKDYVDEILRYEKQNPGTYLGRNWRYVEVKILYKEVK